MSKTVTEIPLRRHRLNTSRVLSLHRYGTPGARPKVYIQAALHANEIPALLVARHLIDRLDEAAERGDIQGEILVVPVANPVGLDQVVEGDLVGRFALDGAGNFNRDFPDLTDAVAEIVRERIGPDPATNVTLIRQALMQAMAELPPADGVGALRQTLLGLAIDADIVLDLHCDLESLMHLYTGTELWPEAADLAAYLGAKATFLAEVSGGDPFDEACSAVWWKLRAKLGAGAEIPAACFATTVELRGRADVSDELASADAAAIVHYLQRRGVVGGQPAPVPPLQCEPTPLAGVERIKAPAPGVVAYRRQIGDRVEAGEIIADLVDPGAEHRADSRIPLKAGTSGLLWSRRITKVCGAGDVVASIASPEPLVGKGAKLLTS